MQDLAINLLMTPQAAAANATAGKAGKANLFASLGADQGAISIANKFSALLNMFAAQTGQEGQVQDSDLQALLAGQNGEDGQLLLEGMKPVCVFRVAAGDDNAGAVDPNSISPETMSKLASMLAHFPHLQSLLASKADLKQVVEAVDFLLQGGNVADLSQFNLPQGAQDLLTKLAGNKDALNKLGNVLGEITSQPELMKAVQLAGDLIEKAKIDHAAKHDAADAIARADDADANAEAVAIDKKLGLEIHTKPAEVQGADAKVQNVLADARVMVESNPKPAELLKSMIDTKIKPAEQIKPVAEADAQAIDPVAANFDEALVQAMHASDGLLAGKHSIMSAGGIEAYRQAQAGNATAQLAATQVAVQIQRNIQAKVNNFYIQLQPEELGRIEVTLKFEGSKVRALISAEKEETLQLLKHDSQALNRALQGSGMETDASSLEFSLGHNFQNFNEAKKNHRDQSEFGTMIADKDLTMDVKQDLNAAHIMLMASGRVDVKL